METGQHVERIMGKIEACLSSLEGQSCLFSANSSFPSINLPINLALFFFSSTTSYRGEPGKCQSIIKPGARPG